MNTENLRQLFQSEFDYKQYTNEIVHNLFGCNDVAIKPELLDTSAEGDRSHYIGRMEETEGRLLGFFYTRVAEGSDVRRKRVGLRKLIAPYLKYDVDAAVAVFDDGTHWRLSYICDMKEGTTTAKRFSYILGDEHGQYKTPLERLDRIASKNGRFALDDLKVAFSVDALSKEFFDEYHDHYDTIVEELEQQGKEGAVYHDYVKKMMGRIVFLHFLQKKGWLNDNQYFLRDLFFFSPYQTDFLEQVLEPLFFGIFNTEKEKRSALFEQRGWDNGLLDDWKELPYLNGGLFEEDDVDRLEIKLPASLFEKLFTFLASYNFTVDENDPDDAEIGVDPEMLGKIFESLLEDNKAKGAFYTPKEIVRYMCKESLIAYLNEQCTIDNEQCSKAIRTFVETHEMQPELEHCRETLDRALREVKICDPAIGSGAFPMGLLNELWRCREAMCSPCPAGRNLTNLTNTAEGGDNSQDLASIASRSQLKKEIIENNIYGVDIEKGAIDIARLRFWLSIVVDSDEPEPLPNFDYKFMQGNSLIESFGGHDLSHIMDGPQVVKVTRMRKNLFGEESTQTTMEFFGEDSRKNLKIWLSQYFSLSDHRQKADFRKRINESVKNYIERQGIGTEAIAKLNAIDPSANQEFFLWHTWFKDIFDKGGFDIVIGNPPYGAKITDKDKRYFKGRYFCAKTHPEKGLKGSTDTFVVFIELGHSILGNNGNLAYIVPMSVGSSDALTSLQSLVEESCGEIRISSYSNRPKQIFDAACVRTSIFMFNKNKKRVQHVYTTKLNRRTERLTIKDIIDGLQFVDSKGMKIYGRYAKVGTEIEMNVLSKLFSSKKTIADYIDIKGNEVFYRAAGGRYFNVVTNYPTYSSAEKSIQCRFADIIGLIMSSSYFYFYQQVYTDGLNLKRSEIENFPLPVLENLEQDNLKCLSSLYKRYLIDIEQNASIRQSSSTSTHNISSFKEYKIVRSKQIINEIDNCVGPLYGLTQEQIDFIKNYEIEYRMAGE